MAILPATRDIRIDAVEIELSAGPGWLESREFDVLPLEAHFEGMLAVDFGDIVGDLERGANLIRGQEGIAAEGLQAVEAESRKTAVFGLLRDPLDTELTGKIRQVIGLRRNAGCMEIVQTCADDVN